MLALNLTKSLCIPQDFNAVLTGLISKHTKNCTVHQRRQQISNHSKYMTGPAIK